MGLWVVAMAKVEVPWPPMMKGGLP